MSTDMPQGQFQVDQLSADTLYKVFMRRLDNSHPGASGPTPALSAVLSNDISSRGHGSVGNKVMEDSMVNADDASETDNRTVSPPLEPSISRPMSVENLETASNKSISSSIPIAPHSSKVEGVANEVEGDTETCTLVATGGESLFLLDKESASANLDISKMRLTVMNKVNKKWSTARADVKMVSGVHRWSVHIDRCISKNIFIGVVSGDARLDNYVGCDRHGWAFLANKAIWHNKGKLGGYGELFRSGRQGKRAPGPRCR